jgi:SAM-dependent methyltransferase
LIRMEPERKSSVDWEADVYARGQQLNRWPYSEVVSAVMRARNGRSPTDVPVLEIGCGAGNNVWFLAAEGFPAHGVEMSPTAVAHALERLRREGLSADLRVGDIAALPWPDESFEIVIDRGALTQNGHPHISRVLTDVRRVLRPGGLHLSFTLWGMGHPHRRFGREVAHHTFDEFTEGEFATAGLISFFTAEDLELLFRDFSEARIDRIVAYAPDGSIRSEEFSVRAVK